VPFFMCHKPAIEFALTYIERSFYGRGRGRERQKDVDASPEVPGGAQGVFHGSAMVQDCVDGPDVYLLDMVGGGWILATQHIGVLVLVYPAGLPHAGKRGNLAVSLCYYLNSIGVKG